MNREDVSYGRSGMQGCIDYTLTTKLLSVQLRFTSLTDQRVTLLDLDLL